MLIPRATIRDMFDGGRAASMIGYVTMGMSVVPMIAPVIGGVLDETLGWRANFALMGILGIGVLMLVWIDMGETVQSGGVPLRQQIRNYPVLLRSVRFWGYCLAATLSSGAFFAYLGGAPFVGEKVFGLTSSQVGYYFAAPAIGYLVGNFVSGRFAARMGVNRMILWGTTVCFVPLALALLADLAGFHDPLLFFGATVFMGLGNGLALPSANAGMMNVRPELAGTASGLGGAMAIAGGAALSALAGAMLTEGRGAAPLLIVMTLSALGAVLSILWVKWRERQLGLG